MKFISIPLGVYQANCYILWDEDTKKTAIIDPGGDYDEIDHLIKERGFDLKYIILTHAHADHIGAVAELKDNYDVDVLVHKEDFEMLKNKNFNHSDRMGNRIIEIEADKKLSHEDKIAIGKTELMIIHTPGHSKGSICIKCEDKLFTGDTLFAGSIGRTDLEGGSFEEIIKSIKERILILPDNTLVYPGHGPASTVEIEKKSNPFLL